MVSEDFHDRFLDTGVEVDRVDKNHILIKRGQFFYGLTNFNETITKIFTTMSCYEDNTFSLLQCFQNTGIKQLCILSFNFILHPVQCIDDSISCYKDIVRIDPLSDQIRISHFCRSKVKIGNLADDLTVYFLRKRSPFVKTT